MQDIPLIEPPKLAMKLADGRELTWQEFGLPDGNPVLYFHGGGSVSFEAGIFHREAVANNLRIIATNRPGTGGSSPRPGRPVAAYSEDLVELLDKLKIDRFACLGESNGGMVTMAVAATMSERVVGGIPINPTLPWFDPLARSVSSRSAAMGYRLLKYLPHLVVRLAVSSRGPVIRAKHAPKVVGTGFDPRDLIGPAPGVEDDVAALHWRFMDHTDKQGMLAEIRWATSDWEFDHYSIPTPLDFFCGVHDSQAPFALVLADRNPDARFHSFSFGHHGFSHPDARRRIMDVTADYFRSWRL